MIKSYVLFLLMVISGSVIYAQEHNELGKARKKRDQGLYIEAAEHYKNYLDKTPSSNEVNTEFAEMLYFEMRDYATAYPYMKRVLTYERDTISYYYALAKIEHYMGNYATAERMYKALANIYVSKDTKPIIEDAKLGMIHIAYCYANKDKVASPYLRVVNLGDHVNSVYAEYVPVVDEKEDFIMFTSRRKNQFNQFPDVEDDKFHEDMYMSKRQNNVFDTAVTMPYEYSEVTNVENTKAHESLVSLSPDGKTLFIYKEGTLWKSAYNAGKWAAPVKVGKEIISKDYVNHVSVSQDGKTIYFTSEKANGNGKLDIYKTEMQKDGSWSNADNLGNTINTNGNEQSPFIASDGKTLYFSSDAREGYGGYDIYKTIFDGKKWSKPENLGMPYNSVADDVFFSLKKDNTEGFFSSNRMGGIGDFDIYRFYYADKPSFDQMDIVIVNKKEIIDLTGNQSAIDKLRALKNSDDTEKMFYRINDSLVTEDLAAVEKLIASGSVKKLEIEKVKKCANCVYKNSEYYTMLNPVTSDVAVNNNANTNNTGTNAAAETKVTIYFDFNSYKLTDASNEKLQQTIEQLKRDEKLTVMITGYADYKGSAGYNKNLSAKRANAVKKYISNDIKRKRIKKTIGEGEIETDPACIGKPCEEEQNAKNRRVEVMLSHQ